MPTSGRVAIACATELAVYAEEQGLGEERIVPRMDEWEVFPRAAVATAMEAQRRKIATIHRSSEQLHRDAVATISNARNATDLLFREGLIAAPP